MHEQEFLGNRPRPEMTDPPKDWAQAAAQGQHELDEGARLAAHGDIRAALVASATGVGLLAEALQLQADEEEQAGRDTAVMALHPAGQAAPVRWNRELTQGEAELLALEDPRLSKWDVLDGVGQRPPAAPAPAPVSAAAVLPPATVDYLFGGAL